MTEYQHHSRGRGDGDRPSRDYYEDRAPYRRERSPPTHRERSPSTRRDYADERIRYKDRPSRHSGESDRQWSSRHRSPDRRDEHPDHREHREHREHRDSRRYEHRPSSGSSRPHFDDRGRADYRRHSDRRHHAEDGEPVKFDRNRRLSPFRGDSQPLGDRPRQLHNWDAAPPGFERIRADIAKQTGLFPPPGNVAKIANFAPPVLDPARAAMLAMLSGDAASSTTSTSLTASGVFVGGAAFGAAYAKHSKRVYVGNMPVGVSEQDLEDYFNSMLQSDRPEGGEHDGAAAVSSVMLSNDRTFAFVDFKSTELTSLALEMNGMLLNGSALKVKRPRDPADTATAASGDDDGAGGAENMLVLSNVPSFFEDVHVKLLLQLIGDLKVFIFLRQRATKQPLGVTVFQYDENIFNEICKDVLAEVKVDGSGPMTVSRVSECRGDAPVWATLASFGLVPDPVSCEHSNVVVLINLIPQDALLCTSADQFDGIEELVRMEAIKYGPVLQIVLPRPHPQGAPTRGLGLCYIEYEDSACAESACEGFSGRRFNEEIVLCALYPAGRFQSRDF